MGGQLSFFFVKSTGLSEESFKIAVACLGNSANGSLKRNG